MTSEESGLNVRQESEWDVLPEEWVDDFLLLSFLPGDQNGLASFIVHHNGASFQTAEAGSGDLLAIDETERQTVGKNRAQFFNQIESKRRAAGTLPMQIANGRIKAHAFQRADGVVSEQGVEEREQGVHVIERRTAAASVEEKIILALQNEVAEDFEVSTRSVAFVSADAIQFARHDEFFQNAAEAQSGLVQDSGSLGFPALTGGAQKHRTAVGDFGSHDRLSNGCRRISVVGKAVLLTPKEYISGDGPLHLGKEASVFGKERQAHAIFGAEAHQERAATHLAEADDAGKRLDRNADLGLLFKADRNGFAIASEPCALDSDVESVQ